MLFEAANLSPEINPVASLGAVSKYKLYWSQKSNTMQSFAKTMLRPLIIMYVLCVRILLRISITCLTIKHCSFLNLSIFQLG